MLHQLDPIPERIKNMRAFVSIQWRLGSIGFISRGLGIRDQRIEIVNNEGGVSFTRGLEIHFDAEMELHIT